MKSAGCQYSPPKAPEDESELSIVGGPKSLRSASLRHNRTRAESSRIGSTLSNTEPLDATVDIPRNQSEGKRPHNSDTVDLGTESIDPSKTKTIVKDYKSKTRSTLNRPKISSFKNDIQVNHRNPAVEKRRKPEEKSIGKVRQEKVMTKNRQPKRSKEENLKNPAKVRDFTVSCTPDPKSVRSGEKSISLKNQSKKAKKSVELERSTARRKEKTSRRRAKKNITFGPIIPSEGLSEAVFDYLMDTNFYGSLSSCQINKRKGTGELSYENSVILNELNQKLFENYESVIHENVEQPIERAIEKFPGILEQNPVDEAIAKLEAESLELERMLSEKIHFATSNNPSRVKSKIRKRVKVVFVNNNKGNA